MLMRRYKDALAKMHNDHVHLRGFTPRNIRRYLPANNPNVPRPKNSPTETSVETSFSDTRHNDDDLVAYAIIVYQYIRNISHNFSSCCEASDIYREK